MDGAIEVDGSSVVSCGEAAEVLEAIAVFVGAGVVRDEHLARSVRRDHGLGLHVDDGCA